MVRPGSIGIGEIAAAGSALPFFLTNKLAPSSVFANCNSTVNCAAFAESAEFAGGGTCRVSAGARGGAGIGRGEVAERVVTAGARCGILNRTNPKARPTDASMSRETAASTGKNHRLALQLAA